MNIVPASVFTSHFTKSNNIVTLKAVLKLKENKR